MTDMSNGTAWIDDAFAAWDAEAQEHCFKSHVYSDKLRARRAELLEALEVAEYLLRQHGMRPEFYREGQRRPSKQSQKQREPNNAN